MKPAPFELHRATSIEQAVELLSALDTGTEEAKIIAGGQSLVPMMNFRLARPDHLVDLSAIDELNAISTSAPGLSIGAMVRQSDCLEHPVVARAAPLLAAGLRHIGHGHIRNRGTIGGSVAHADPAAELPAVLMALDAEFEIAGTQGRRRVSADRFFQGWFTTDLAPNEILVAVHVPLGTELEWGFEELARRHGDFAMVLAATVVHRGADGTAVDARIVLGGVGPVPVRARSAEQLVVGTKGEEYYGPAAAAARNDCSPTDDVHADRLYRTEMVEVLVERCLRSSAPVDTVAVTHERSGSARRATAGTGQHTGPVTVNGDEQHLDDVPDRRLLADWLRDDLDLTGTHLGCEHGVCGACTVLLDGEPVRSCLTFAAQAAGREVTTIEALGTPVSLHPIQEAFRAKHGLQCGFCTPGMVLATVDLLARNSRPTEQEIRAELSGNLCRCTGYVKIIEAVQAAADALR